MENENIGVDYSTAANASPSIDNSGSANISQPAPNIDSQQTQADFITKDFANRQYDSLKGMLDRKYAEVDNQYKQLNQNLSPLINLLQANQQTNQPDPIQQDPIGSLRTTYQEMAALKEIVQRQEQSMQQMQNMYQGGLAEAKINEQFRGDFPSTQDLERAKALFVNTHKEVASALLSMNNNDPVAAFGKYVKMLQSGVLSDNQDATSVANALNQAQRNKEKAMQSNFGNSNLTNRSVGNPVDVMQSFSF